MNTVYGKEFQLDGSRLAARDCHIKMASTNDTLKEVITQHVDARCIGFITPPSPEQENKEGRGEDKEEK